MKRVYATLVFLLLVVSLFATVDVNTIFIKPEFMKPGTDMDVTILVKKVIDNVNQMKPIKMVAVLSDDDTWSTDDMLFLYDGAKNSEPLTSVDGSKAVYKMTQSEWFEGWFEYTWPTKVPNTFMHGQKKFIIIRIAEGNPNWDTDNTIDKMDGTWFKELAVEFEVAENKAAIYNTAYVEDKSDTAKFIISKGLPDAFLEATPPGNGIAGIGTETVFTSTTLDISLTTTDKVGAKIYYTTGNKSVDISDDTQLYDSTKGVRINGTDTVRAIAVVPGYKNREGVWYYKQDLPDAYIFAVPSVDTPGVYSFTTSELKVSLGIIGKGGDTLELSDSVQLYYTLKNQKPIVGDAATIAYASGDSVKITSSDTIRALAVVKGYDVVPEGIWYYEQNLPIATLRADPGSDTVYVYNTPTLQVKLSTDPGNTIYFTQDGTTPDFSSSHIDSSEGWITVVGDDTVKAFAVGDGYIRKDSAWIYRSELPKLYLKADAGNDSPRDTLGFYFDTTVTLQAYDSDGNVVTDAKIYYLLDSIGSKGAASDSDLLFNSNLTIDTTVTIRAIALHDMYQAADGEWNYKLMLENSWLHAYTSDSSYLGDSLILGDSILQESDTAHFGYTLGIVLASNSDSVLYTHNGDFVYEVGDTIYLTESDPDTVVIKATTKGHGYTTLQQDLVFVRDTVEVLSVDPAGHKFSGNTKVVLNLSKQWRNQTIWFDTSGSYEQYQKPIAIDTTTLLKAVARADFAVDSRVVEEFYLLAIGVEDAFYLDLNGDGAIDAASIYTTRDIDSLPSKVQFISPFDSGEVVTVSADELEIVGERTLLARFNTPFVFHDKTAFEKASYGLMSGDFYVEKAFDLSDSVAPVVVSATYQPGEIVSVSPVEREDDQLLVRLSEPVSFGDLRTPFELKRGSNLLYTLSLKDENLEGESATFNVEAIHGVDYPEAGDSLHLSTDADVAGVTGVEQKHEENRFVPLDVRSIPYKLLVQDLSPVVPWEFEIPEKLKSSNYTEENALLIVADFLMKMENAQQDGSVVILDKLGNVVASCSGKESKSENITIDVLNDEHTRLVFYWDGRNNLGRRVGAGKYIAEVTIHDGREGAVPYREVLHIGVSISKK